MSSMAPDGLGGIQALPGLADLWDVTVGDPAICIAVLDGPVDRSHPSLEAANLNEIEKPEAEAGTGEALRHGTQVASIIFGQHDGPVKGIAPGCRGVLVPIFRDEATSGPAPCSQLDLAHAIGRAVDAGAHIINVSAGEFAPQGAAHPLLAEAVRSAARSALIVAAAGNEGCDCLHVPGALPSVLAVGAADRTGLPLPTSNWGQAYRTQGILALGEDIVVADPGGGASVASGTSCATAIVAGIAALFLSLQRKRGQRVEPSAVRTALLESAYACDPDLFADCRPFLVGQLDIAKSHARISGHPLPRVGDIAPDFAVLDHTGRLVRLSERMGRTVVLWFYPAASTPGCTREALGFRDRSAEFERRGVEILGVSPDPVPANAAFAEQHQLPFALLSDTDGEVCHAYGACSEPTAAGFRRNTYVIGPDGRIVGVYEDVDPMRHSDEILANMQEPAMPDEAHTEAVPSETLRPSSVGSRSPVFVLAKLGYQFASETRRDAIAQHMGGDPGDARQLLDYLDKDPPQAAVITWTLLLGATTIYVVEPQGAYADVVYERLRQFLDEQLTEGAERISVPGVLDGETVLMSGQIVPVLRPELMQMYSWSTSALVRDLLGEPPPDSAKEKEHTAYAEQRRVVTNFLERVYHELRNLGLAPADRAMNYAATNAWTARTLIVDALREGLELDSIEAEPSPICRPGSECWDVKLTFFNPRRVLEQARVVHRFAVDVGGPVVSIDEPRTWSVR
jgi:peroxiredoxin